MPIYKQASKFLSLSIFFHHIHTEDAFSSFLGLLKISSTQKLRSFHGTATQLARSNLNASPSDCSIFVFMKMIFGDSYSGFLLLCFKSGTFVFVLDKQRFVHFFFISYSTPDESMETNTFGHFVSFMVDYNQNS